MDTVLDEILEFNKLHSQKMIVRFILSIDRSKAPETGLKRVALYEKYKAN